jgi:hypothetical protein
MEIIIDMCVNPATGRKNKETSSPGVVVGSSRS